MVPFSLRIAHRLAQEGVDADVIDVRTVSPLDSDTICASVEKTGRLCVIDPAWQSFGISAEIIARVVERSGRALRTEPLRVCHPDSHTPMSSALEALYYPEETAVAERLRALAKA
jgi:pyruvate dehydrogenase E1 component beta subunit